MADDTSTNPQKPKKSLWQLFNELLPGISYKAIFILCVIGIFSFIYRWIKWHF
jgi:hypothetical protein